MWCQLFSEPGAGSDLASLATRAVPEDGRAWRVNGQKVWSSFATESRYGMLLARTDPDQPKNAGITCFLVDMTAPGVTVRPLRQLTGDEHFCEVFLEDLMLGPETVLGPVNEGWRVAMTTLNAERSGLSETSSASGYPLQPVLELARRTGRWRDPLVRDRLTDLFVTEHALALTNLRSVAESRTSGGSPTGSITKLVLSELSQEISELGFELGAAQAAYWDDVMPPETHALLDSRRFTMPVERRKCSATSSVSGCWAWNGRSIRDAASRGVNSGAVDVPTVTVAPSGITFEAAPGQTVMAA
ncbi:acyl-CoA dehydrogenase family protein, partial [Mycolicibacterium insubricum]|uniref:acyl-CoA dehydrogenase family protein n=1 Tax=Mycolicibacterium insubricum TaxID=444597 RepID=UPI0021F2868B